MHNDLDKVQLKSAVLLLVFNRPQTTKLVFEAIRSVKPPVLFVASDGARLNRAGEAEIVSEVRKIATAVDWPCELHTLFREQNLGCKLAVSSAINWFFSKVDQGIILEDDCLAHKDFFYFSELMLEKFKNDKSVGMISGFNPEGSNITSDEYFFSRNHSIWGWSSWRDRWQLYDINMGKLSQKEINQKIKKELPLKAYLYQMLGFLLAKKCILNTWDYQWVFCLLSNQMKTIKPAPNLIMNIGVEGAHASGNDINHYTPYGSFKTRQINLNQNLGNTNDNSFFKNRLPNYFVILFKLFLALIGFYSVIRSAVTHRYLHVLRRYF
jgi:hypothetical protein